MWCIFQIIIWYTPCLSVTWMIPAWFLPCRNGCLKHIHLSRYCLMQTPFDSLFRSYCLSRWFMLALTELLLDFTLPEGLSLYLLNTLVCLSYPLIDTLHVCGIFDTLSKSLCDNTLSLFDARSARVVVWYTLCLMTHCLSCYLMHALPVCLINASDSFDLSHCLKYILPESFVDARPHPQPRSFYLMQALPESLFDEILLICLTWMIVWSTFCGTRLLARPLPPPPPWVELMHALHESLYLVGRFEPLLEVQFAWVIH